MGTRGLNGHLGPQDGCGRPLSISLWVLLVLDGHIETQEGYYETKDGHMWPLNDHLRPLSGYNAIFTVPTIVLIMSCFQKLWPMYIQFLINKSKKWQQC